MTTLIFGKNSQVGKELLNFTVNSEIDCTFYNSKDLNFNNNDQIQYVLNKIKPDIIVNLAAFTDVDASEENYGDALIINAQAPGLIASISKDINASFINISTDYVFGKVKNGPFSSSSETGPINSYGKSKLKGEILTLQNNNKSLIIRTASVFSVNKSNFVKSIAEKLINNESLEVIENQLISMTYAKDLANLIYILLDKNKLENVINKSSNNIIHFTNEGFTNWYEVASFIKSELDRFHSKLGMLKSISAEKWKSKAKRPYDSRLSIDYGVLSSLDIGSHKWQDRVKEVLNNLNYLKDNSDE